MDPCEAIRAYFDGYRVVSSQYPTLCNEYQNPLFLKTLCEAYQDKTLPQGHLTFAGVLQAWEERISDEIQRKADCPIEDTRSAVTELVRAIGQSNVKRIPQETARNICLRYFNVQEASRSLYRHLNSEGLLQEVELDDAVFVRLQYERFSDTRVAQTILKGIHSKQQWIEYWLSDFLPRRIESGRLAWGIQSELIAYALLLPETVGIELVECPIGSKISDECDRSSAKNEIWNAWLEALPWRAIKTISDKCSRLFATWANYQRDLRDVYERLFQFACIPEHPLNADFLHQHLKKLKLADREVQWTIVLAKESPTDNTANSVVGQFLYWTDAAVGKATGQQVRLAASILTWLTSSSNRGLRNKVTDAAIRLLVHHPKPGAICLQLLSDFWDVDDPYIKERLLAIISGVLPYLNPSDAASVSLWVLKNFWEQECVEQHILQREYAAFIVQYSCSAGLLPLDSLKSLRSRARLAMPQLWTEEQVAVYSKAAGYAAIEHSLRPEEMGMYGDFGRYVMGGVVHRFIDDKRAEPVAHGMNRGGDEHDARFARRYIWQRVVELGWIPEKFTEFERGLGYSRRLSDDETRVERISKKFQWIGLHEYLGHLEDTLLVKEWDAPPRPLAGAWELHMRDYDPSLALRDHSIRNRPDSLPLWWKVANPIAPLDSISKKRAWVQSGFLGFEHYLTANYLGRKWVILYTHLNFDEEMGFGLDKSIEAEMSQWVDARALLIPRAQVDDKVKKLESLDFYGDGVDIPSVNQCWLTEYPWHPSFKAADQSCLCNDTWFEELRGEEFFLPVCELADDSKKILLPSPTLHSQLGELLNDRLSIPKLMSDGSMQIHDSSGRFVVAGSWQSSAVLMIDQEVLMKYLKVHDYGLVWGVLSEKSAWNGSSHVGGLARQSAVYVLDGDGKISGGLTLMRKEPPEQRST